MSDVRCTSLRVKLRFENRGRGCTVASFLFGVEWEPHSFLALAEDCLVFFSI